MSTETEQAWCCECGKHTIWKKGRVRAKCTECGTSFPCKSACRHVDCQEARGELECCGVCMTYGHADGDCPKTKKEVTDGVAGSAA